MQPHSLCIAIADKLRERILTHQMPPGSYVNDGALALEFGISRTPVREAMKLLCHEGLLTAQQLCILLEQHLVTLARSAPGACQELTHAMHAMAQAKLRLASGSSQAHPPYA